MIITNASAYRILQNNMTQDSSTLNQLYIESSSGKAVTKPSDNPSAVGAIINGNSDIVSGQRYIANCQNVQNNLTTAETAINSVEGIMTSAKEIAVEGANDSLTPSDRSTLANQVSQLKDSLLGLANTKENGKYIFAGYNDQTPPFSETPVTNVVNYTGTSDHQMIEVSPGTTVANNITGSDLFTSPVDLFATLDNLTSALNSGDSATISAQLTPIENASNQVTTQLSQLGNTSSRMDDMITMQQSAQVTVKSTLSQNQDADLATVLSNITQMETSLQATMQVTARVSNLSLINYLS